MWDFVTANGPVDSLYPILALLLSVGLVLGYLARLVRLPSVTGYLLAGLLLGPVFHLVDTSGPKVDAQLEPITSLALSLIAITIGSHLQFGVLRNAFRRILVLGSVGTVVVPLLVFPCIYLAFLLGGFPGVDVMHAALFMAILAIATAPATVVHVVKESQAKGVFVKTLIAVVVLNNVANILLFEGARHWVFETHAAASLALQLGGAIALGVVLALLLMLAWRRIHSRQKSVTFAFAALIVGYGLSLQLGLSPVLTNLALGITMANLPGRSHVLDLFEDYEVIVYTLFFTLTGTHANFSEIGSVGILAGVYLVARIGANLFTVYVSGRLTQMPRRVSKYLGLALTPQAGITVGLIASLGAIDTEGTISGYVIPAVLLSVTVSEMLGPLILRFSLRKSGEVGLALPRLIDFLQEEYITVECRSRERTAVIKELVHFLYRTHPSLKRKQRRAFLEGVLNRELQGSTGVGKGVSIPHGVLEGGKKIVGVMGVIREGIEWESVDGQPVHMVILVGTPPGHREQHLGALRAISELFRRRSVTTRQLHLAKNAAEVYEALVNEEFESLNEVLEDALTPSPHSQPLPQAEPAES
jgi:fructose PTS system EIIBC or EIIC component